MAAQLLCFIEYFFLHANSRYDGVKDTFFSVFRIRAAPLNLNFVVEIFKKCKNISIVGPHKKTNKEIPNSKLTHVFIHFIPKLRQKIFSQFKNAKKDLKPKKKCHKKGKNHRQTFGATVRAFKKRF